jgi:hypothetical protein
VEVAEVEVLPPGVEQLGGEGANLRVAGDKGSGRGMNDGACLRDGKSSLHGEQFMVMVGRIGRWSVNVVKTHKIAIDARCKILRLGMAA